MWNTLAEMKLAAPPLKLLLLIIVNLQCMRFLFLVKILKNMEFISLIQQPTNGNTIKFNWGECGLWNGCGISINQKKQLIYTVDASGFHEFDLIKKSYKEIKVTPNLFGFTRPEDMICINDDIHFIGCLEDGHAIVKTKSKTLLKNGTKLLLTWDDNNLYMKHSKSILFFEHLVAIKQYSLIDRTWTKWMKYQYGYTPAKIMHSVVTNDHRFAILFGGEKAEKIWSLDLKTKVLKKLILVSKKQQEEG